MAFGGPELPTSALLRFGVVWALVFILTGIFEEFAVRGYPQFTLTRSVGFWPAAIITSLILSLAHAGNSGEAMLGLVEVFAVGLLACLMLRRTRSVVSHRGTTPRVSSLECLTAEMLPPDTSSVHTCRFQVAHRRVGRAGR